MEEDPCAHLRPSQCIAIPDVSVNDRGKLTDTYRYDDYTVSLLGTGLQVFYSENKSKTSDG